MNLKINKKKILSLLMAGTLALSPVTSLSGSYESGIDLEDDITLYENIPRVEQTYEPWFMCYDGTCWGDLIYQDIQDLLPPYLLNYIKEKKWKIRLVPKGWMYYQIHMDARGGTFYREKKAAVEGFYRGEDLVKLYQKWGCDQEYLDNTDLVTLGYLAVRSNVFHEIGHIFNERIGTSGSYKYSRTKEWREIYEEEKMNANGMSSRYWEGMTQGILNLKSTYEFMSTCFEAYILCRDDLKECCPKAYEYIHNIIYTEEKKFEEEHPEYDYYNEREKSLVK